MSLPRRETFLPMTDQDYAAHLGRVIIAGLIANRLTPEEAYELGTLAGTFGRRALAHQEVVREGWSVIQGAFGAQQELADRAFGEWAARQGLTEFQARLEPESALLGEDS